MAMDDLNHEEATILGLLGQFERPVLRTKFVKLVYLLDQTRYQTTGRQSTSFTYQWDHFGPNALGNAIVDTLDRLVERRVVVMTRRLTPYENDAYCYQADRHIDIGSLPLTTDDWVFIKSTFDRFGRMRREQIVRASKNTEPVKKAKQYEALQLTMSPAAERLQQEFDADEEFAQSALAAADMTSGSISWEELKAEIEQTEQVGF